MFRKKCSVSGSDSYDGVINMISSMQGKDTCKNASSPMLKSVFEVRECKLGR
ncbi:hypothetical protein A2U01_0069512, partial [Trifolium medium]|nr:hypothetical protein [Trifolium medium]